MSVSPLIASLQDLPYFATLAQSRGTDWLEQTFTLFEIDGEVTRHDLTTSFAATFQSGAVSVDPELDDAEFSFDEAALLGALQAEVLMEAEVLAAPVADEFPYLSEIEDPDIDLDETALFDAMLDGDMLEADMQAAETEVPAEVVSLDVSLFEALDVAQAAVSEAIDQVSGQLDDTVVPDLLASGDNFLALDLHRDTE